MAKTEMKESHYRREAELARKTDAANWALFHRNWERRMEKIRRYQDENPKP